MGGYKEYKVIMVGNSYTGKTTLSTVLAGGNPKQYTPSTIGAEYRSFVPEKWFGTAKMLGIWDTAGQVRYANIVTMYYRKCNCVIYCIPSDATLDEYQNEMDRTIKTILEFATTSPVVYICVTKCDLIQKPWQFDWLDSWVWKWANVVKGVVYTSAYENIGVKELFDDIADTLDTIDNRESVAKLKPEDEYCQVTGGIDLNNWKRQKNCCTIV